MFDSLCWKRMEVESIRVVSMLRNFCSARERRNAPQIAEIPSVMFTSFCGTVVRLTLKKLCFHSKVVQHSKHHRWSNLLNERQQKQKADVECGDKRHKRHTFHRHTSENKENFKFHKKSFFFTFKKVVSPRCYQWMLQKMDLRAF